MKLRLKYNKTLDAYTIEKNYGVFFWTRVRGPYYTIERAAKAKRPGARPSPLLLTSDGGWSYKDHDLAIQGMQDMLTECENANIKAKKHKITKMETKC